MNFEVRNEGELMLWIAVEGPDFCGKTTLCAKLTDRLNSRLIVRRTRHPGATRAGEYVRAILKDNSLIIDPLAAQCLLAGEFIDFQRSLNSDEQVAVISDRYNPASCFTYGIASKIPYTTICDVVKLMNGVSPDILYIIDCPLETLEQRRRNSPRMLDRFELADIQFRSDVWHAYRRLHDDSSHLLNVASIQTIDGTKDSDVLADELSDQIYDAYQDKHANEAGQDDQEEKT